MNGIPTGYWTFMNDSYIIDYKICVENDDDAYWYIAAIKIIIEFIDKIA